MWSYLLIVSRLLRSRGLSIVSKRLIVRVISPKLSLHLIQNFHISRRLCASLKNQWCLVTLICVKWGGRLPRLVGTLLLLRPFTDSLTSVYRLMVFLLDAPQLHPFIVSLPVSLVYITLNLNSYTSFLCWLNTHYLPRRIFRILGWHRIPSLSFLLTLKKRGNRPYSLKLRLKHSLIGFLRLAWGLALCT